MWFDDELGRALGRVDAPKGFTERTLARRRQLRRARFDAAPTARPAPRAWSLALGLAASLTLTTALGLGYLHRAQQADAARVREDVRAALRITSSELNRIHRQVVRPADTSPAVADR